MNNPTTPKRKIPPDIYTDPMQLTIPTIPQNKKGKAAVNQSNQSENSQNSFNNQSISYSLVNHLLEVLLELEKDKEIQIAVQQQLEILNAIKEVKTLGKKDKLKDILSRQVKQKTTENVVISQLQKQVENLENSVENKFNLILKSIETTSQNEAQNHAQIQAQIQSQIQSSNEIKSYAQVAADNTQIQENNFQTFEQIKQQKQQKKQQEKELEKQKYREKRLIIQVEKKVAENINSYQLRNQINDRFFTKENINLPVIATVTKSFTS